MDIEISEEVVMSTLRTDNTNTTILYEGDFPNQHEDILSDTNNINLDINSSNTTGVNSSSNSDIITSINELINLTNDNSNNSVLDFTTFKNRTKVLLEQLINKLLTNELNKKELNTKLIKYKADLKEKDKQLIKLIEYYDNFLDDNRQQSEDRLRDVLHQLDLSRNIINQLEKQILYIKKDNLKLQNNNNLLRICNQGSKSKTSGALISDLVSQNEELKSNINELTNELNNLKLQRNIELSVVSKVLKVVERKLSCDLNISDDIKDFMKEIIYADKQLYSLEESNNENDSNYNDESEIEKNDESENESENESYYENGSVDR